MANLQESLRKNDLIHLVDKVFEIDAYQSKIGDDKNVVVLSFTVDSEDPAKDLENFVEMGYDFVLDADVSPGESDDGKYKVFIELERNRHTAEQILEILDGVERITGMPDMRFRYFKNFTSHDANLENLANIIPITKASYERATNPESMDNFSNFFSNSSSDKVDVIGETIKFNKLRADPLSFRIINSGLKEDVYASIKGPIMIESKDIAEVMFYTKYIGNYNINKIGNTFIFENNGWAVSMERNNGI
jgi:hypothetical protein